MVSILSTTQKRMQLLWALVFIIIVLVPIWILTKQIIFSYNLTTQKLLSIDFQQQIQNRTRITNFRDAKIAMYQLYSDHMITFYCGCDFTTSHTIDLVGCGLPVLKTRIKTEAEHIVPASHFGKKMACWKQGGRDLCNKKDTAFQKAEGDLINLVPAIGYINQRRSDYHFGEVSGEKREFGACDFEINKLTRTAEPPPHLLGFIARITLYMDSIYGIGLRNAEIDKLKAQSIAYPPTDWEILRDQRIAKIQGNHNPFVVNF